MRITQLANFHSPTSGGLRVAVDTLRDGYLAAGHECTLVVPGPRDAERGTVRTLRSPRLPNKSGYRVILRKRAVLSLLDELRPEVLEVHDKLLQHWVWPWAQERRVPVVAVSHERLTSSLPMLIPFAPDPVVVAASAAVARRTVAQCDLLVTCSRFAAAEFGPSPRLRIVPLGVDLAAFRPSAGRRPDGPARLVVTSRLSTEKRPDLAIDTLRTLVASGVDAELTVVGDGPQREALASAAAGVPVRFAGFQHDRAALAALVAGADLALVPGPVETFGLAALEALACGTPIVAVAGSACAEFVGGHPAAGLAAASTPEAFATAARMLLSVPRAERRGAARSRAEQYPWSATVAAMLQLHESVAQGAVRLAG